MWRNSKLLNQFATYLWALNLLLMMGLLGCLVVNVADFNVHEVRMSGALQHVSREQVQLVLSQYPQPLSLLTLNLAKMQAAFGKLPWARKVRVRRYLSAGVLEVHVDEHQALARWGDVGLVNQQGEVFYAATDAVLPIFYGHGSAVAEMSERYTEWMRILQPARLDIAVLGLSEQHSWQLWTTSGMLVVLGRTDNKQRLQKFIAAYRDVLGGLKNKIHHVDLRYSNGFAVRAPVPVKDSHSTKSNRGAKP